LPDGKFLRGAGARGVEAGDDWAEEINAVYRIIDGRAQMLVAIYWMADESPSKGVKPEDGYGK
jgi:hypothetical protein